MYKSGAIKKKQNLLLSGTITRSQGNTTGTSRTKPAKVMRRITSSSSEMATGFTTTSWRRGKYSNYDALFSKRG